MCLENPMGGGTWLTTVHGVAKSRTRLSVFTFTFHFHALEKEMATHSSVLAWRIPGMGDPGGLPSMGSHRVRNDWSDLAAAAAVLPLSLLDILYPNDPCLKCTELFLFHYFRSCVKTTSSMKSHFIHRLSKPIPVSHQSLTLMVILFSCLGSRHGYELTRRLLVKMLRPHHSILAHI